MQTRFLLKVGDREHAAVLFGRSFVLDTFRKVPLEQCDDIRSRSTPLTSAAVVVGMPVLYETQRATVKNVVGDGAVDVAFCDDGRWRFDVDAADLLPRMGMDVDAFMDAHLADDAPSWTVARFGDDEYLVPGGATDSTDAMDATDSTDGTDSATDVGTCMQEEEEAVGEDAAIAGGECVLLARRVPAAETDLDPLDPLDLASGQEDDHADAFDLPCPPPPFDTEAESAHIRYRLALFPVRESKRLMYAKTHQFEGGGVPGDEFGNDARATLFHDRTGRSLTWSQYKYLSGSTWESFLVASVITNSSDVCQLKVSDLTNAERRLLGDDASHYRLLEWKGNGHGKKMHANLVDIVDHVLAEACGRRKPSLHEKNGRIIAHVDWIEMRAGLKPSPLTFRLLVRTSTCDYHHMANGCLAFCLRKNVCTHVTAKRKRPEPLAYDEDAASVQEE